jgi:hypothetical protein
LGYPEISDQRIFFIMYIDSMFDATLAEKIALFETSLQKFRLAGKKLTDVRKLLQGTFRQRLERDVVKYRKSKMCQKQASQISKDSIPKMNTEVPSTDSPCAFLDYKNPKNKVEQFAVIARFRELNGGVTASMRDDFEAFCTACGIKFEKDKFSDDMKHGREAGLFSNGNMVAGFPLSPFGQKYVDLLPDRDAIKALKESKTNVTKKSKK